MNEKTQRLFFALWPSQQERKAVVDASLAVTGQSSGRVIPRQNLHITLHFIGQANDELKACLHTAAQSTSGKAFKLTLDQFGYFRRAKTFWLGPKTIPAALVALHRDLGDALSPCGFQREQREYQPHVSLIRKCSGAMSSQHGVATPCSLNWTVNEFVLLESVSVEQGVRYRVIERYPLT